MSRGSCPTAIENTASLLQIILADTDNSNLLEKRLAYGMALTRFVNSVVDPEQQSMFAKSIASIATQMGLPTWFVELRHESTHENLPSIAILRDGAQQVSLVTELGTRLVVYKLLETTIDCDGK